MCDLVGEEGLEAVVVENNMTGERRHPARALFVFIGATSTSTGLAGQVELDEDGFALTGTGVRPGARRAGVQRRPPEKG